MGWNAGYTIFESTVVGAYNLGVLDKKLLAVLMEPYRNTDIDSGGERNLKTKDGKCVRRVVIETFGGKWPPTPKAPEDYLKWTEKHRQDRELWWEEVYRRFGKITKRFGWH